MTTEIPSCEISGIDVSSDKNLSDFEYVADVRLNEGGGGRIGPSR